MLTYKSAQVFHVVEQLLVLKMEYEEGRFPQICTVRHRVTLKYVVTDVCYITKHCQKTHSETSQSLYQPMGLNSIFKYVTP